MHTHAHMTTITNVKLNQKPLYKVYSLKEFHIVLFLTAVRLHQNNIRVQAHGFLITKKLISSQFPMVTMNCTLLTSTITDAAEVSAAPSTWWKVLFLLCKLVHVGHKFHFKILKQIHYWTIAIRLLLWINCLFQNRNNSEQCRGI